MSSSNKAQFMYVGDYVFSFAYPISFLGALFYSISSLVNIDPSTIIANRNISVLINILVGICGLLSMFAFLKLPDNLPFFGPILLPNGNVTIKSNVNAATTYSF